MPSTLLLLPISAVAGFVGALAGMGGGVVLIPVLTGLGIPIKKAIAVSMVSVVATSSGAASAYVRDRITNLKVGMFLEMFTMIGALIGAWVTLSIRPQPLYFIFGAVLLASWATLFMRRHKEWHPIEPVDSASRWLELGGHYYDAATGDTVRYHAVRAWVGGLLMLGAGFLAGLLGIGAGALKVLIHDLVMGLPPKVSTTTSNLIIGVTALAGTSVYLYRGWVDPALVAPVILGVVAGAFVGTRVLVRLHNQSVKHFFLLILAVLGSEMIWRGIRG